MNSIECIDYKELLSQLKENNSNHLLLGNGFNNSLGINTTYEKIFFRMKEKYLGYEKVAEYLKRKFFNIEELIDHLKKQVPPNEEKFLEHYIENKVKLDFMKATNEIVQESIKKVYQEKNQYISLLFKNFTNYFTLNYDPLLYLLLLKFKNDDSNNDAIAFQNTALFQQDEMNQTQNNIYTEIQEIRDRGELDLIVGNNSSEILLNHTRKSFFESLIKEYNKKSNRGWKSKDIKKVCDQIWQDRNQPELHSDDGFQQKIFVRSPSQNLYFLHGAFHIIKDIKNSNNIISKDLENPNIQKIAAKYNKAFLEKLEETIHNEDKDIVCVLTNQSEEKLNQINDNLYLRYCFEQLSELNGSLVILGSSLAKNDRHIFDQISKSNIDQIYVSSCNESKSQDFQKAQALFKDKKITLFDYTTISYEKGNSQ